MAKQGEAKTNVMRILEQAHIGYTAYTYPHGKDAVDGVTVALSMQQDPETVFKTLVARGKNGGIFVFSIPVAKELDLKKAAKAVGEKAIDLVHVQELLGITGYIRGGCSPIGMKKIYPTILHQTAIQLTQVIVSAGKIGSQVAIAPDALLTLVGATTADIVV